MGTVPIGTGELRTIHSRVSWMLRPVERSMTVSAPQRIAQTILSTSEATSMVWAIRWGADTVMDLRSEEHTSELQSRFDYVFPLLLEQNNKRRSQTYVDAGT